MHTVIILGASGNLAQKKIYPSLFSLYNDKLLPQDTKVVGYARSHFTPIQFEDHISQNITCRLKNYDILKCKETTSAFFRACSYIQGDYTSLSNLIGYLKASTNGNDEKGRIFYLSLPPSQYPNVIAKLPDAFTKTGWNRVIVEKPFGHDMSSCRDLTKHINNFIPEESQYCIDHYLGKDMVENILYMRFQNAIFEPLWNHQYIHDIEIKCYEDFGVEGRVYFDETGITRDIVQNHLLQILCLVAMEPPKNIFNQSFTNEKIKVLKSVLNVATNHVVFGQYETYNGNPYAETFVALTLYINNSRWQGVPFILKAGKGMSERCVEITIRFKTHPNILVIRVQPNASIKLKIVSKSPGYDGGTFTQDMLIDYQDPKDLPDAYEKLILDCFHGQKRLFMTNDELEQSWRILDDVIQNKNNINIFKYPFGTTPIL